MKKQANKTASSGSSDKDSSAESSAPEEGEQVAQTWGWTPTCQVEAAESEMGQGGGGRSALQYGLHLYFSGP